MFTGRSAKGRHGAWCRPRRQRGRRFRVFGVLQILLFVAFASGPSFGQEGAVSVVTEPVLVRDIERRVEAIGTLRSEESVVIRPEVEGRITQINFEEGARVGEGALLIRLDDSIQRASLEEARAKLELDNANAVRAEELAAKGSGTARAHDEAFANRRVSTARVRLAEAMLKKRSLSAPFGGVLGLRQVSVGDYVEQGQDIVNLEAIDALKVDFRVPELFLADIRPGQKITVHVDAFKDARVEGAVYAINPLIDENGRSVVIRARIPNTDFRLRPGLFARIDLALERRDDAVTVPEQAIVPVKDGHMVFRVVDGKAVATPVTVGIRRQTRVEIVDGLSAGDMVVTAGQLKLRDGVPVSPRAAYQRQGPR